MELNWAKENESYKALAKEQQEQEERKIAEEKAFAESPEGKVRAYVNKNYRELHQLVIWFVERLVSIPDTIVVDNPEEADVLAYANWVEVKDLSKLVRPDIYGGNYAADPYPALEKYLKRKSSAKLYLADDYADREFSKDWNKQK